jgi:hypothetical protein
VEPEPTAVILSTSPYRHVRKEDHTFVAQLFLFVPLKTFTLSHKYAGRPARFRFRSENKINRSENQFVWKQTEVNFWLVLNQSKNLKQNERKMKRI